MKTYINGKNDFESYVKERDEALLSMDKDRIIAFCEKYDIPYSKDDKIFWATVYKCIYNLDSATHSHRIDALLWCIRNGFDCRIN